MAAKDSSHKRGGKTQRHKGGSCPPSEPIVAPAGYTPRIVVKFRDDIALPYDDHAQEPLENLHIGPWGALTKQFPGMRLRPLFTAVAPARIRQLVNQAVGLDETYHPPNFFTYFLIEFPPELDHQALVKALLQWNSVETAYFDPPGVEPTVDPTNDPRATEQKHLDAAPNGIDARFAWNYAGGDGEGQHLIDLERGWTFNHVDLVDHSIALLHGLLNDDSRPHGTKVLGVACAVDNAKLGVGIAPKVAAVNVVSHHGSTIPNAILAAIDRLPYGGVLLVEVQIDPVDPLGTAWRPIETLDGNFQMIRLATALGITVVEAAGNGGSDLDGFVSAGKQILNRSSPHFLDSGAILVGAADQTVIRTPSGNSNFGSRVDCYAWGDSVVAATSTDTAPFDTLHYTTGFGGTSAASAIIAGAALVVQGIAAKSLGTPFNSRQMRNLLANKATGTLSEHPGTDLIGVMPELQKILSTNQIGLVPDVYLRDFVGDIGDLHNDAISASPDIILRPAAVVDPQAAFGEGSGTENSNLLGAEAEAGQDNFVYVRVRNRRGTAATDVTATVYWSPVATLVTPDLWKLVGSTTIPSVPSGNFLTVSDAITWPATEVPPTGHYCFVGLVGNALDPAPAAADFLDWDRFQKFIRDNNNVSWRNFNVVDNEPSPSADPEGYVALPFLAPGAPDKGRRMQLEVVARLPLGSKALLEMPLAFYKAVADRPPADIGHYQDVVRMPVSPIASRVLGEFFFPAKSRNALRLLVQIPKEFRRSPYEVCVRQSFETREVGRVTWRLVSSQGLPAEQRKTKPANRRRR